MQAQANSSAAPLQPELAAFTFCSPLFAKFERRRPTSAVSQNRFQHLRLLRFIGLLMVLLQISSPHPVHLPSKVQTAEKTPEEPKMAEDNSYEEQRRRQVQENRRKLDELRLHRLSAAVREAAAGPLPKTKPLKLRKARPPQDAPIRRSGRLASLPKQPDYRDINILSGTCITKRELPDRVYATDEERAHAITKAEELADKLDSDYPTFVKPMTHYYATSSWLAILPQFSKKYLPWCDEMIILVDEEDAEFHMLYHAHSGGIGNGWRQFAIGHKLADGDCLVFQLVERTKFKVYITTASSYYENDH